MVILVGRSGHRLLSCSAIPIPPAYAREEGVPAGLSADSSSSLDSETLEDAAGDKSRPARGALLGEEGALERSQQLESQAWFFLLCARLLSCTGC